MPTALELYESHLDSITDVCADPWFSKQLALSRAGDEQARRRICGSCLRLVLDIAKRRWRSNQSLSLLDFVQDGNAILMKMVKRFTGTSADEFLHQLTAKLEAWYTLLLEHPDWAPKTMQ